MKLFHETENKYYDLLTYLVNCHASFTDKDLYHILESQIIGETDYEVLQALFSKENQNIIDFLVDRTGIVNSRRQAREDINNGAIYIKGDNSDISSSFFENNVARNGSAIYNRGQNLTIEDDTFIENQAWSYLITGITNDKRFYYDPEANVTIDVTHMGGDNIINAIYNDGSPNNIFFKNISLKNFLYIFIFHETEPYYQPVPA